LASTVTVNEGFVTMPKISVPPPMITNIQGESGSISGCKGY
jgi:hypothetical protein